MATDFPALVDTYVNPDSAGGDLLNTPRVLHDEQHARINDAMAAVQRLLVAMGNVKNVMDPTYGAIEGAGHGATNRAAIAAALLAVHTSGAPGRVFIPVDLEIDISTPLIGAKDCDVFGGGRLTTSQTTAGAFFVVNGKDNFGVENIGFVSPNDNVVAVQLIDCANPTVTKCTTANARLVVTGSGLYGTQTDANACTNVKVFDNDCTYTGTTMTSSAAIWVYYAIGAKVRGNTVSGYNQGIVWWGGDASSDGFPWLVINKALTSNVVTLTTSVAHNLATGMVVLISGVGAVFDGFATLTAVTGTTLSYAKTAANVSSVGVSGGTAEATRRCRNVTICSNTVTGCGGGGIWGSMGFRVTVSANNVSDCGDVGIDFEGTWIGTATGNTVADCVGGNLTTFYANRGITFVGNTCSWTVAGVMVRIQSGFGFALNRDVTFSGNTFTGFNGISVISIEPTELFTWADNHCTNVRMDTLFNPQGETLIDGGSSTFTVVAPASFDAIHIGANAIGGRVTVRNTKIRNRVAQPAGCRGIWTWHDDATADVREWIDGNTIEGFADAISTEWHGSNAAFALRLWVRDNTIDVGATIAHSNVVSPAAATAATVNKSGNFYGDGTVVP